MVSFLGFGFFFRKKNNKQAVLFISQFLRIRKLEVAHLNSWSSGSLMRCSEIVALRLKDTLSIMALTWLWAESQLLLTGSLPGAA
jgi:hypothetical protein